MVLPELRYGANVTLSGCVSGGVCAQRAVSGWSRRGRTVPTMQNSNHMIEKGASKRTRRNLFAGAMLLLTLTACGGSREAAPESGTQAAGGTTTTGAADPNGIDGAILSDMIRETWCEKNQRSWCTMFDRVKTEERRHAFMYLDTPYTPESASLAVVACEDLYKIIGGGTHPWRRGSVLASGYLLAYRDGEKCRVVEEFYGIEKAERYETDGLHGTIVIVESNENPFVDGRPEKLAKIEAETTCVRVGEYLREGLLIANSPGFSPLTRTAYEGYAAAAKARIQTLNCPALPTDGEPTR